MVGILVSFWDGLFLGAMLVLGGVINKFPVFKIVLIMFPLFQHSGPKILYTPSETQKNLSFGQTFDQQLNYHFVAQQNLQRIISKEQNQVSKFWTIGSKAYQVLI